MAMVLTKRKSAKSYAEELSVLANNNNTLEEKKRKGQYFTSNSIANFMANLAVLDITKKEVNVLDAGAGTGILISALVDKIIEEKRSLKLSVDAFENDELMQPYLKKSLDNCKEIMEDAGCDFEYRLISDDFILYHSSLFKNDLFTQENDCTQYNIIIGNPPYFKVKKSHIYSEILSEYVYGQPNVYFMFMIIAANLLEENGQMIFITPRSYTSGAYFEKFRQKFFEKVDADHIHVFNSRKDNFKGENVLQENIILSGFKRKHAPYMVISSSTTSNITDDYEQQVLKKSLVFDSTDQINLMRLPVNKEQAQVIELFDNWTNNLSIMNMNISTGPVVTFRNKNFIEPYEHMVNHPLFHMRNLKNSTISFDISNKEDGISNNGISRKLLIPSRNYVLLKRFTSKEQKRRVDVSAYDSDEFDFKWIGLENHLNYIYKEDSNLTKEELYGVFAFLNSDLVDHYFRIVNGNTQVNASDIRPLSFPEYEHIVLLGRKIIEEGMKYTDVDQFLLSLKGEKGEVSMSAKEEQAKDILKQLELPVKQQNQRSALTLLALLNLKEDDAWSSAKKPLLRIVDIMDFMAENYDKHYAPNSRETVRRQTIHQFEQAQLIVRNPDNPHRATNSGNTVYEVTDEFLLLVQSYGIPQWNSNLEIFKSKFETLTQKYEIRRNLTRVPVKINGDQTLELSPGEHNVLQKAIVEDFAAYFAQGAQLLYLGDTEDKYLYIDEENLKELNFPELSHDKLPDVVLYQEEKNWLYLCEAVTSHGPISDKRKYELEKMLENCKAGLVFITAFPSISIFKKYADDIAWETEVWFSDTPKHLMHLNGDRFLGPR